MTAVSGLPGLILCIFAGLVLGSFATALIWRVPRGQSWIATGRGPARSACPQCGHVLGLRDLVPVFSWIMLRGRCRYCREPVGAVYPAIEGITVLLCLLVWGVAGWTLPGAVMMAAVPFLVALVAIDLEHMILPDQINGILFFLGVCLRISVDGDFDIVRAAAQSAEGGVVYAALSFSLAWGMKRFLKREAMGLGDVKFFAVAGVWLGLRALPVFLLGAGLCGVFFGILWKKFTGREQFPFGPALIAAFTLCLLCGPVIMDVLYG